VFGQSNESGHWQSFKRKVLTKHSAHQV
jgi:hypothetical protein